MTSVPSNRAAHRSRARRGGALGASGLLLGGSAAAVLGTAFVASPAGATPQSLIVDNGGDTATPDGTRCTNGTTGDCTLRDAIDAAGAGDTITFDLGATGDTISITQGTLLPDAVKLLGPGSSKLTISSAATAGSENLLYFTTSISGDVTISGLSFDTNRIRIRSYSDKVLVDDVTVSGSTGSWGGALYVGYHAVDLEIRNSTFDSNTSSELGGAVYARSSGDLIISTSTFSNNSSVSNGGAVYVASFTYDVTITDVVFDGNTSSYGSGGALFADNNTATTITGGTFSNNRAEYPTGSGGGAWIQSSTSVAIEGTTFDNNYSGDSGGGVYITSNPTSLLIANSTISNNIASGLNGAGGGGALIAVDYDIEINNSTISGNKAIGRNGGGLYMRRFGALHLNQTTIADNTANSGGGVWALYGPTYLSGSIVSTNTATTNPEAGDIGGAHASIVKSDHSIVGLVDTDASKVVFTDLGGTLTSSSPGLLALDDNGGPTKTMALAPDSIAIDAGPDPVAFVDGSEFDQRGTPWLRVYNGAVDIGAFELQPDPRPGPTPPPGPTPAPTPGPNPQPGPVPGPNREPESEPSVPNFAG